MRRIFSFAATAAVFAMPAYADDQTIAKDHAPIGVMGDHMHNKGEVMFSYRYMHMSMDGSQIDGADITPEMIVTTIPNRFFGAPMQPPTLRVTPTEMSMNMHMLGAMAGVTDWLTVMAMGSLIDNEMDHLTFQGPAGVNVLGEFETQTDGVGDTKLAGLVKLFKSSRNSVRHDAHLNVGFSIPTGSLKETGQILTPMGGTPSPRLPYPMQLGSGTFDLEPGVTYNGRSNSFSWGAQYRAAIRTGTNDEGYSLGDIHQGTGWVQYGPAPSVAFSVRGSFISKGRIDGIDPAIAAPVQTANPDFHGGERFDVSFGVNLAGQSGAIKGHRFAIEAAIPVHQKLNGPQLETDWTLTAGWQKAF